MVRLNDTCSIALRFPKTKQRWVFHLSVLVHQTVYCFRVILRLRQWFCTEAFYTQAFLSRINIYSVASFWGPSDAHGHCEDMGLILLVKPSQEVVKVWDKIYKTSQDVETMNLDLGSRKMPAFLFKCPWHF